MPRQVVPELDEPQDFTGLLVARQVGVGITEHPALVLLGEERLDAGVGLAQAGDVVVLQYGLVSAVGDGMEIQSECVGPGHQHRRQSLHPARQEPPLLVGLLAIGVIGGEALLGQDVQSGEESQRLLEIEVIDVAASLLVQEFQRQEAEHCGVSGDHP